LRKLWDKASEGLVKLPSKEFDIKNALLLYNDDPDELESVLDPGDGREYYPASELPAINEKWVSSCPIASYILVLNTRLFHYDDRKMNGMTRFLQT
jgi:hypothetical protein